MSILLFLTKLKATVYSDVHKDVESLFFFFGVPENPWKDPRLHKAMRPSVIAWRLCPYFCLPLSFVFPYFWHSPILYFSYVPSCLHLLSLPMKTPSSRFNLHIIILSSQSQVRKERAKTKNLPRSKKLQWRSQIPWKVISHSRRKSLQSMVRQSMPSPRGGYFHFSIALQKHTPQGSFRLNEDSYTSWWFRRGDAIDVDNLGDWSDFVRALAAKRAPKVTILIDMNDIIKVWNNVGLFWGNFPAALSHGTNWPIAEWSWSWWKWWGWQEWQWWPIQCMCLVSSSSLSAHNLRFQTTVLSPLESELAWLRSKLERKWSNDNDEGFTYIPSNGGPAIRLTPSMMKEWARSIVSYLWTRLWNTPHWRSILEYSMMEIALYTTPQTLSPLTPRSCRQPFIPPAVPPHSLRKYPHHRFQTSH